MMRRGYQPASFGYPPGRYLVTLVGMSDDSRLVLLACFGIGALFAAGDAAGREDTRPVYSVSIDCRISTNNDGCEQQVHCPTGTTVLNARAACNLEYGAVSDAELALVPEGLLTVVDASDHVDEGSCWIQKNQVSTGEQRIEGISDLRGVSAGCQEHDRNGGDCHIRGVLLCR
jgi:hypothetical protein